MPLFLTNAPRSVKGAHQFHTLDTFTKIVLEERKSFANEAEWLKAAREGHPDYKDEDDGEDD